MSLRAVCGELVVEVLRRALGGEGAEAEGRLQLVVDETTVKIVGSFLKMGDLYAEGVTSMELVERPREPLPALEAMYLLRASAGNVDLLLGDFKTEATPQHSRAHLVFSQGLAPDLLAKLAEAKHLAPRVKTFMEIPLSFIVVQDRGFHFDMRDALPGLFPSPDLGLVNDIAHRLVDVCRCLQTTAPGIRHAQTDVCRRIAEQVQEELSVCRPARSGDEAPCQLLIVDRSIDMAATLVHEYTYEAVAYDLLDGGGVLDIDRDLVTVQEPGAPAKEFMLNETDALWEELKHMHLEGVQQLVHQKLEEVASQNVEVQDASLLKTSDLLDMLRRSPENRDMLDKLKLHFTLIEKVFTRLQEERLTSGGSIALGLLEQDIACGIDRSGKDVKATNLQASLSKVFSEADQRGGDDKAGQNSASESRLRLLMLYFACMDNISEVVRQKLIELARLQPEDQQVLMSMLRTKLMEVPDSHRHKQSQNCVHRVTKEQAEIFKRNARADGRFELSRFEPRLKQLMELLAQNRLSEDDFPSIGTRQASDSALRSAGRTAAGVAPAAGDDWCFGAGGAGAGGGGAARGPEATSERLIVFVVGGLTHSELRSAAEVAQALPRGAEVLAGGTALLTPRRLIQALRPKNHKQGGVDLNDLA